jgi:hypothetical protein
MTIHGFVEKHGIRFSAEMTDRNPNMIEDEWSRTATHWRCTIRKGRRVLTIYFSQGPAVCREPTAADVLDCLASDASSLDSSRGFEDWARDLGYDPDSRKAESTYRAIERQTEGLRRVLGDELCRELIYNVERL